MSDSSPMAATPQSVPRHIAIVMDGNGRWASRRFMPRVAGHKQGVEALRRTVKACADRGVQVLTVFAFSSENWKRPDEEVSGLMDLLMLALGREVPELSRDGVRLQFHGDRARLSERVRLGMQKAEQSTAVNDRLVLNICFNYGGRWDIVHAVRRLQERGEEVTQQSLDKALADPFLGEPDLIIRTGGEMRLSNFLLWQAAYSELYFSPLLWPDFDAAAVDAAIAEYASRERLWGGERHA